MREWSKSCERGVIHAEQYLSFEDREGDKRSKDKDIGEHNRAERWRRGLERGDMK